MSNKNYFMLNVKLKKKFLAILLMVFYAGCGGATRDYTRPGRISDLQITETGSDYVVLQWTAPGDDGFRGGSVVRYEVRYSITPLDRVTWDSAMPVLNAPPPSPPGTIETFRVSGLEIKERYYFGVRAYDDAGNKSELSNITSTVTQDAEGGSGTWYEPVSSAPPSGAFPMGTYDPNGERILFLIYPSTLLVDLSGSSPGWQVVGDPSPAVLGGGNMEFLSRGASNIFYLFGGVTGSSYTNSEYFFDPVTMNWAPFPSSGQVPSPRAGACTSVNAQTGIMYLFGGEYKSAGGTQYYNDVYEFDPGSDSWALIEPSTQTGPQPRGGSACIFIPQLDFFVVMGGKGSYSDFDDMWVLDFNFSPPQWRRVIPAGEGPGKFFNAKAFYDESVSRVVLVGGVNEKNAPLSNPWMFTINPSFQVRWIKLKPEGTPPPERSQYDSIIPDPEGRRVFYFSYNAKRLYVLDFNP